MLPNDDSKWKRQSLADGKGNGKRVRARNGDRRGSESRVLRGWSDVRYGKTSLAERQRLRFSIFKIITSVTQGQQHAERVGTT